jgi:hypothetical protein
MNNTISHMSWLWMERTDGTGARTCKIVWKNIVCTTGFWLEMNNTISHKSWLRMQRTDGTGSGTLTLYISTMCVPLTPSISPWLLRKVHFATVYGRHTNIIILVHKLTTKYLIWIGCGCTELMEQEQGNHVFDVGWRWAFLCCIDIVASKSSITDGPDKQNVMMITTNTPVNFYFYIWLKIRLLNLCHSPSKSKNVGVILKRNYWNVMHSFIFIKGLCKIVIAGPLLNWLK